MQGSFEDIYDKLYPKLSQDIYYTRVDDNYETIESANDNINDINDDLNIMQNKDNLIMFNINEYLDKMAQSFNYDETNIDKQFTLDFGRSVLYLNGKFIRNKDYFIKSINNDFNYPVNFSNMNMATVIFMLCNQASFAFPFSLMNKIYSNYDKGIYVFSNNIKYFVTKSGHGLTIELVGIFNIKNININKVKGIITVTTKLDLEFEKGNYVFPKFGIIHWQTLWQSK